MKSTLTVLQHCLQTVDIRVLNPANKESVSAKNFDCNIKGKKTSQLIKKIQQEDLLKNHEKWKYVGEIIKDRCFC